MGANDTPATTRSVVTEYFDWRLNNQTTTNSRLSLIVRRVANECETAFHAQQIIQAYGFSFSLNDVEALNNVRAIHREIAREIFSDDRISWGRILTVISFSAILAEFIIQHPLNHLPPDLIKSSLIDWTTNFIDTEFHEWLEGENYWTGCLKHYDRTPQRRNSISRIAGIVGTLGMLTLGALYMRRT